MVTVGFLSALFTATSISVLESAGYEFRAYGFLLLFSTVFLLSYTNRLKKGKSTTWKDYVKVGLWMIPLAYTHYFGVLMCVAVFLIDVYWFLQKKIKWQCIYSYLLVFLSYIPWLLRFVQLGQIGSDATWQTKPSLAAIVDLFQYLSGNNSWIQLFFLIGIVLVLFRNKRKREFPDKNAVSVFLCYLLFVFVAILYLYGTFVKESATLWVNRYFLCIYPCAAVLAAYGAESVITCIVGAVGKIESFSFGRDSFFRVLYVTLAACMAVSFVPLASRDYSPGNYPYEEAADWLYNRTDIYDESTITIMVSQEFVGDGWYEYYMTRKGERDDVNYISQETIQKKWQGYGELLKHYDTVYYCYISNQTDPGLIRYLNSNYELQSDTSSVKIKKYVKSD